MIDLQSLQNKYLITSHLIASLPSHYERDQKWQGKGTTGADRYILQTPNQLTININDAGYVISAQQDLDLSLEATWDQVVTDYRVAATRAGLNFYVYACQPTPTTNAAPTLVISANSTYPDGYTAANSRKIGGFHSLCTAVGTIASHTLTDYAQGDILPASIWDIIHRPYTSPEGMVFDAKINKWVDIYLASGTGASTASVNGGTISDSRNWMDFVDDGHAVKKRLLTDIEFQSAAAGSNEETNISGSADPGTTGGHSDTAAQRMISNIGCEDMAGVMYQWLQTPSARLDNGTAGGWYDLAGAKGSFYTYGTNKYGNTQLRAGGPWNDGSHCGSRCRSAYYSRWFTYTDLGCRFLAEPL